MATKISTEILTIILNNLKSSCSTQDLHSSLLVNRIWCEVTILILWKLPFGEECCIGDKNLKKKALCIQTYISCMDTQARTLLSQNGFNLSSSPPQAAFDYPSFTREFIINNLVYFISIYLQKIIEEDFSSTYSQQQIMDIDQDNNNDEITITKSRILFLEIFKLIINRCTLDDFKLVEIPEFFLKNFCNISCLIGSILDLPGVPKVFKKLESFTSTIRNYENYELICPLYGSLKSICNNILNMDLSLESVLQVQLLAELISVQKRLENLSIINYCNINSILLLQAIFSRFETLKSLHLKLVLSNDFERKSSIGKFALLQELYIEDCYGLNNNEVLSLASLFTQLKTFHYFHSSFANRYSQTFIIKVLETASTNLKNIYIDLFPVISSDIFSAIVDFSTTVTELTLYNINPSKLITMFDYNFSELRKISFKIRQFAHNDEKQFHAKKLLNRMAENIPGFLESITIRISHRDPWRIDVDSLRNFFKEWCHKGENNRIRKFNVECSIEPENFGSTFTFIEINRRHLNVIEEYGIQFQKYNVYPK